MPPAPFFAWAHWEHFGGTQRGTRHRHRPPTAARSLGAAPVCCPAALAWRLLPLPVRCARSSRSAGCVARLPHARTLRGVRQRPGPSSAFCAPYGPHRLVLPRCAARLPHARTLRGVRQRPGPSSAFCAPYGPHRLVLPRCAARLSHARAYAAWGPAAPSLVDFLRSIRPTGSFCRAA
ncbi:hypothetical protein B0H11DRAFT_2078047 [Mycena galericulata]|nr:hypothetical protein B0H11DRAFT_2078047 [Mycena galericulata]